MQPIPRVFSPSALQRIGLQNQVLRELRAAGCRVARAALDAGLTLELAAGAPVPPDVGLGGVLRRRLDDGRWLASASLHGCTVRWIEEAA